MDTLNRTLPLLLGAAWLLPLLSFTVIVFFGRRMGKAGRGAALVATGAIITSFVLSASSLVAWVSQYPPAGADSHAAHAEAAAGHNEVSANEIPGHGPNDSLHTDSGHADEEHAPDTVAAALHAEGPKPIIPDGSSGDWSYSVGKFGSLELRIDYYIDALTLAMFTMVTLIASCIHIYAMGYMHEELHDVTDPLVTLSNGQLLKRRGRYYRFFQFLSLFCFSMLGLVIAGNIAMVFIFWELVGVCSYFLIGFYIERKTASTAANKAFITNRVGDFGMIIGLMVIWTGMGTFSFGDYIDANGETQPGVFSQVRPVENHNELTVPNGLVLFDARDEVGEIVAANPDGAEAAIAAKMSEWHEQNYGYWLLILGGVGIFCGCVGKSAQFPLHVWLPDAMEGPTPVSALVHSATMVAAGVYLVGRFYPVFTPEVLLIIAYAGCITLFMAATIAITATDIKRVLAYSTISQLGYMMLSLGLGGWLAGIFHLFTHAFFKSLLFMCSGSVIHACHTNEMPQMGGLLKKMPYTAWTMLVGCLAIAGAGIPFVIGLSGYYSKDYIIGQALSFSRENPTHGWMFYAAVLGAGITAFYMFRLWYMTFVGKPRDEHIHAHAHESPKSMYVPLIVLAVMATIAGWNIPFTNLGLEPLLEQARHPGTGVATSVDWVAHPAEHDIHGHDIHVPATMIAFSTALMGVILATLFYGLRKLNAEEARRMFSPIHWFLLNKWWFDELYDFLFIRPSLRISAWISACDKKGLDWLADNSARAMRAVSRADDWIDRLFVDGAVNLIGRRTHAAALWLRTVQTGSLRQYVMFIAVGTVALFVILSLYWNYAVAGG